MNPSQHERVSAVTLFRAFCEGFERYEFPSDQQTLQDDILNIFAEIGRQAGYQTRKGRFYVDLIWRWDEPNSNASFLELVLEHESHRGLERYVIPEVKKLRYFKSLRKIVMYYPEKQKIEEDLPRIRDVALASPIAQQPPEEWLVLALSDFRFWTAAGVTWNSTADATMRKLQNDDWHLVGSKNLRAKFAS
jgi:hypothetical protein